ncbi:MarR family winged helix-turn-helix transcriptional regulator [Aureimonas pseudogalii]|uniref:DNA-binding MarR family transcriptional regulator n=1 Tax=Aureimonas pseudogalii TaxID=1744844 RepID=A0A7W6EAN0_9HYPH|nr:MarR family transcriptional regulator [Aureimonas pseudogalii]MBB3997823.1 DNA-binding MarR family transcriptional regulator [Aureimonas pseudogalii]
MADAPLLDAHLCFALYGASMAVGRLYKPMLDEMGLTYPQYLVLAALWEEDGPTIGALAGRLALESSTVTPLVKRLESAGFVERRRDTADERQVRVSLTPTGRDLHARSACLGERLVAVSGGDRAALQALNGEVTRLRDVIAAALRAAG